MCCRSMPCSVTSVSCRWKSRWNSGVKQVKECRMEINQQIAGYIHLDFILYIYIYTFIYLFFYMYKYIYMCVCARVCVCLSF